MTLGEYQKKGMATAKYKNNYSQFMCAVFGLNGEAGEIAEKIKKNIRVNGEFKPNRELYDALILELGDLLWYVQSFADALCVSLEEVAQLNLDKLKDRAERNVIHGSGDNR